jgi:hypothetical protein
LKIYDFTLFKYIKKLLPQRANAITGIVVEPNVLERSKVKLLNKPVIEDLTHAALITNTDVNPIPTAVVDSHVGIIQAPAPAVISEKEDHEGHIDGSIDTDRTGTNWIQHRYIGKYKLTESASYIPLQQQILHGRPSVYSTVQNTEDLSDLLKGSGSFSNTTISSLLSAFDSVGNKLIGFDTTLYDLGGNPPYTGFNAPIYLAQNSYDGPTVSSLYYNKLDYAPAAGTFRVARDNGYVDTGFYVFKIRNTVCNLIPRGINLDTTNSQNLYRVQFDYTSSVNDESLYAQFRHYIEITTCTEGGISPDFNLSPKTNETEWSVIDKSHLVRIDLLDTSSYDEGIMSLTVSGKIDIYIPPIYPKLLIRLYMYRYYDDYAYVVNSPGAASDIYIDNLTVTQVRKPAEIQDSHFNASGFTGYVNARYNGCKLTGPGINIDTKNTIDGGPVVKVTKVNPNQIVFANNQVTTINQSVTGVKKQTLPNTNTNVQP